MDESCPNDVVQVSQSRLVVEKGLYHFGMVVLSLWSLRLMFVSRIILAIGIVT